MDKTQVLALLDARGISYELAEHEAVFHMGALAEAGARIWIASRKICCCATTKSARFFS